MKRIELLTGIRSVMPGIDKSSAIGSDFLLFDEKWIRSFKEDISVSFPVETGYRTAVRAEELYKILSKMGSEDLEVNLTEDGKLSIQGGKTTIKMNPLQKEQISHSLDRAWAVQTDDLEWYLLPKGFMEGLGLCAFCAGMGPALGVLSGVHFSGANITSTDNFRVSVFTMEEQVPKNFTIPTKSVENLLKLGIEFESISLSKAWVHFANKEGAIFSARLLSGEYPSGKIIELFETMKFDIGAIPYEFPEGLEPPLERAKSLAGTGNMSDWDTLTQISLFYSEGHLNIRASKAAGEIIA